MFLGEETQAYVERMTNKNVAATVSVTRCWNKKLPNCFQKLPKYYPKHFFTLIDNFINSQKVKLKHDTQIFHNNRIQNRNVFSKDIK